MIIYLIRRVLQAVAVLAGVSILIYALLWLLPGGPQHSILGSAPGGAAVRTLRHDYGIGSPAVLGYLSWLGQVLHGNLGYSFAQNVTVGSLLASSLPRTLALTATATIVAVVIAIPAGLLQAVRRGSAADLTMRGLTYVGYGMPSFFLGSVLILLLAVRHHVFGAEGPQAPGIASVLTDWRDLTLPVVTLAVFTLAVFARYMRSAALDSLGRDHVRTARAVGDSQRQVAGRHVLRNSLIPVISLAGLSIPRILAGALVVESLFNIEGIGWQLWQAALKHDFPVLLGFTLVIGAAAVTGSLLADIGYAVADPQIRFRTP